MCLFYFGGFPRNPVYRPIVCQLSGGERVKIDLLVGNIINKAFYYFMCILNIVRLLCVYIYEIQQLLC